ncbi:MAG: DNA-processing protein DprA [Planctomycetota bacterium]|nr:MAG: DNA-processing protein DprA [Planctomycetota bacterium]
MTQKLSLNTQAILLLTAPLLLSKNSVSSDLLTNADYKMVVRHLLDLGKKPADLLSTNANQLLDDCKSIIDKSRMERLLARGFLLGQVVEYWKERSIWVLSRADENYPSRLKSQLKENAPPVIYGCGNLKLLETGGLAVVGSRNVNDDLIEYSKEIGRLAARSKITIISGGAKGVDISSMQGSLEEGGNACGFLSDSLEKAALTRTNREPLMNNQLVLITANDPRDNFTVGFAMQRNKYIYALADASLIVNSDLEKGGTWAGAQEQLEKFHMVPVYVRSTGERSPGIDGLIKKGAMLWPNPNTPSDFTALVNKTGVNKDFRMTVKVEGKTQADITQPSISIEENATPISLFQAGQFQSDSIKQLNFKSIALTNTTEEPHSALAEELFLYVSNLISKLLISPMKDTQIASELEVSLPQTKAWLNRLVAEDKIIKTNKEGSYTNSTQSIPFGNGLDDSKSSVR